MPLGLKTHVVYPLKYLVVIGELNTGLTFFGPFDGQADAGRWATENLRTDVPYRVYTMHNVEGR